MSGRDIYHKYLSFARQSRTLLKRYEGYCKLDPAPDLTFSLHIYHHNLSFVFIKTVAVICELQFEDTDPVDQRNDITERYGSLLGRLTLAEAIDFYETYADIIIAVYSRAFDNRLFELDFRYLAIHTECLESRIKRIENYLLTRIDLPLSFYRKF